MESGIKYYKITFDANNGLGQKHSLFLKEGVSELEYNKYKNEGYQLLGWAYNKDDKTPAIHF